MFGIRVVFELTPLQVGAEQLKDKRKENIDLQGEGTPRTAVRLGNDGPEEQRSNDNQIRRCHPA